MSLSRQCTRLKSTPKESNLLVPSAAERQRVKLALFAKYITTGAIYEIKKMVFLK